MALQRRHHPETRELALQIADATRAGPRTVAAKLKSEHGLTVPAATIRGWITRARDPGQVDTPRQIAQRALSLCSSELSRLERQIPVKRDLDRLSKVAGILKTVEPMLKTKGTQGPMSLRDLDPTVETANANELSSDPSGPAS